MIANGESPRRTMPPWDGKIDSVVEEAEASEAYAADLRSKRRKRAPKPERVDRLPPHAPEAEQGVLGCALLSPNDCLSQCIEKFSAGDEVFYDLRHQTIYANLVQMFANQKPIDVITLQQRLKDFDMLDQIGGIPYLNALQDSVPSAANLSYYADIVEEKWLLRSMIQVCTSAVSRLYDFEGEVDAYLDEVERDVLAVRRMRRQAAEIGVKELVQAAMGEIEAKFASKGALTGLATGLIDLDAYTDGLQRGEMTVLAAYPSVGKTSLAINIAENVVLNLKEPVGVFTMEMTSVALVKRSLCSVARVNARGVIDGRLIESDFPRLVNAAGQLSNAKIYFDDESDLSIFKLRAKARRMWQKYGVKLIIVDYLQLMNSNGGGRKMENRQQEIADISNGLKNMAKELNVPVLAISQLTETVSGPQLRGSRDIGYDADGVWMLESPKKRVGEIEENERVAPIDLWIKKQRNGPRNVCVKLLFQKTFTRFESIARREDDEGPYTPPEPQQEFPEPYPRE